MPHPARISSVAVLAAARTCLEAEGELRLLDVARRLRVRPPSIYHYFPSLNHLQDELVREGYLGLARALHEAEAREPTLLALAEAYRGFARVQPRLYELMRRPGTGPVRGHALSKHVMEPVARVTGHDVDDPVFISFSRVFWSYLHGFIALEAAGQFWGGGDLDAVFRDGIRRIAAPKGKARPAS